jgi:sodium/potassium-transporting ATPase subunit alpha
MIPAKTNAIRGGVMASTPGSDIVPGDIVYIRLGDKVPADLCLFSANDLKVDNSSLTGESDPQERVVGGKVSKEVLEAQNLVFNGTLVVSGTCRILSSLLFQTKAEKSI